MYSAATVKRARTICANADRQAASRKARTRTVKAQIDWRKRPASKAQLARINGLEKLLGYKLSTMRHIGTAGQASDLYQALKSER